MANVKFSKHHFFTFLVFAKIRPECTKVTDGLKHTYTHTHTHTHRETDKTMPIGEMVDFSQNPYIYIYIYIYNFVESILFVNDKCFFLSNICLFFIFL